MKFLLSFCLLILTACATPYQNIGFMGGFTETPLNEDTYIVSFKGNAFITKQKSYDYTLLRSAELALENDKPYFVILAQAEDHDTLKYQQPITATTNSNYNTSGYTMGNNYYGNTHGSSTTTFSGGQLHNILKPGYASKIKFIDKKPAEGEYFDAKLIKDALQKKYKLGKYKPAATSG